MKRAGRGRKKYSKTEVSRLRLAAGHRPLGGGRVFPNVLTAITQERPRAAIDTMKTLMLISSPKIRSSAAIFGVSRFPVIMPSASNAFKVAVYKQIAPNQKARLGAGHRQA